jgi:ubiquinol oxidase
MVADHLNECVEKHAYLTYDKFVKQFGDQLKLKPAPEVAVKYYTEGDLYMFGERAVS